MGNDNYRIVVGEVPLAALGPIDEFFFGGHEFTHSFVALMDEDNNIVEELHGNSYNIKKGLTTDNSMNPRQAFNMSASKLSLIFRGKSHDKLRVFLKTYDDGNTPEHSKRTVFTEIMQGSKQEMMDKWHLALKNAVYINSLKMNYVAVGLGITKFGQNCHSVTVSLLRAMGLEHHDLAAFKGHKFMRPGWKRNLKFDGFMEFTKKTLKGMKPTQLKSLMISSMEIVKKGPAKPKRPAPVKSKNPAQRL